MASLFTRRYDMDDVDTMEDYEAKFIDTPEDDPIFQFTVDEVPMKLVEAESLHLRGDFDTALGIYCNALKHYVEKYGELSVEAGVIYKEYGRCLFERAREFNTAFGEVQAAEAGKTEEGDADDKDSKDGIVDDAADADKKAKEGEQEEGEQEEDEDGADDEDEDSEDEDSEGGATRDYSEENNHADLVDSDLELAMENLDVARAIFENHIKLMTQPKQTNIYEKDKESNKDDNTTTNSSSSSSSSNSSNTSAGSAAGVDPSTNVSTLAVSASDLHSFDRPSASIPLEVFQLYLGDVFETMGCVAMEEESMERALSDLSRSLEIRERVEKCDGRALASVHNMLAMYYSVENQPTKAAQHYTLAASVFVNRMATKMREMDQLVQKLTKKMEDPVFGLSKGSRRYLLEINTPTAAKIDKEIEQTLTEIRRISKQIQDYREIRAAIMEKVADCEEEIKSGLVEDGDGGEKIRKMIKEVMKSGEGETTEGFGNSSNSSSKQAEEEKPVTILAVKRKKPAANAAANSTTTSTDTTTNTTSTSSSSTSSSSSSTPAKPVETIETTTASVEADEEEQENASKKAKVDA